MERRRKREKTEPRGKECTDLYLEERGGKRERDRERETGRERETDRAEEWPVAPWLRGDSDVL